MHCQSEVALTRCHCAGGSNAFFLWRTPRVPNDYLPESRRSIWWESYVPEVSRTYKFYGLVTMEALEEKVGHTHNLGTSCPSMQTGQHACSDASAVNSARLSFLLLMTGQITLRITRPAAQVLLGSHLPASSISQRGDSPGLA